MRVSTWTAIWPQLVAISLIGLGVAGCADSGRFGDLFGSTNTSALGSDANGPVAQGAPSPAIETRPLPQVAKAEDAAAGNGTGSYQYQSANGPARGASPPQSNWSREGGTPVTVRSGQTLEMIAREHGVPVSVLMQANHISDPTAIYPGQRLVIPRDRSATAPSSRTVASRRAATSPRGGLVAPPVVHVVAAGETLKSIARAYRQPVAVIARANNLAVNAKVSRGDRITIPDLKEASQATPGPAEASVSPATGSTVAMAESSQTARIVAPAPTASSQDAVKNAEPAGSLPGFRWPVRGRVIAAFGPKPNGVQNDGINLAVPEGTPIKAAEDGVVAYAGSELKGYGNLVLVRHPNGFVTAYAHASDILVKRGESVKRGQVIAHAGQTGNVTSPQLHFEIRKGATPVDPSQYLSGA